MYADRDPPLNNNVNFNPAYYILHYYEAESLNTKFRKNSNSQSTSTIMECEPKFFPLARYDR